MLILKLMFINKIKARLNQYKSYSKIHNIQVISKILIFD